MWLVPQVTIYQGRGIMYLVPSNSTQLMKSGMRYREDMTYAIIVLWYTRQYEMQRVLDQVPGSGICPR